MNKKIECDAHTMSHADRLLFAHPFDPQSPIVYLNLPTEEERVDLVVNVLCSSALKSSKVAIERANRASRHESQDFAM